MASFLTVWNSVKSEKNTKELSGWKHRWLTCLDGPAGHSSESCMVSRSMWRIMNWGLWLLKCGRVCASLCNIHEPLYLLLFSNIICECGWDLVCSVCFVGGLSLHVPWSVLNGKDLHTGINQKPQAVSVLLTSSSSLVIIHWYDRTLFLFL